MPRAARVLYLGFLTVALAAVSIDGRSWFPRIRLLTLGILFGLAAPVVQWLGLVQPFAIDAPALHVTGLVLAVPDLP